MSEILVRKANLSDMPSIFSLVKELAIFEKAEEQVWTNVKYYEREYLKGTFFSIVAEIENQVVGACIYYMSFSTWKGRMMYLEDFVVNESFRGQGVGEKLYYQFLKEAKDMDCTMVKWEVLDWNKPAISFYEKHGATIEKCWWDCKVIF